MVVTFPPTWVTLREQRPSTDLTWAHHKFCSSKEGFVSSDASLGQTWTLGIASGPFGGFGPTCSHTGNCLRVWRHQEPRECTHGTGLGKLWHHRSYLWGLWFRLEKPSHHKARLRRETWRKVRRRKRIQHQGESFVWKFIEKCNTRSSTEHLGLPKCYGNFPFDSLWKSKITASITSRSRKFCQLYKFLFL